MKPALLFSTTCESKQNINELSLAKNQSQYTIWLLYGKVNFPFAIPKSVVEGRYRFAIRSLIILQKAFLIRSYLATN